MYIIIGLGNPEPEYSNTRHNMGFDVINKLANESDISLNRTKFNAIYGTGIIENEKVILIKPQTFMNNSGESVKDFIDFYKEPLEKVMVIYDINQNNSNIVTPTLTEINDIVNRLDQLVGSGYIKTLLIG